MPLKLRPETVSNIQSFGGTILGSSRGPQDINEMVDGLAELGVDILFAIGGDGTLKCAAALAAEIQRQGLRKSVIAIPKTIDNDIMYLDKSFGFETAFAEAVKAVSCAHVEAICANNGIGLVKLMGGRVRIHRLLRHTVPSSHGACWSWVAVLSTRVVLGKPDQTTGPKSIATGAL